MKMMLLKHKRISCGALAVAVALGCTGLGHGQVPEKPFDVHFNRALKAGQAFTLTTTDAVRASQKTETPDGQTNLTSNFRRTIVEADVRVEKADENGAPTLLTLTLKRLTVQAVAAGQEEGAENPKEILPAGTALSATYMDGGATFAAAGGKPLPADAVAALRSAFHRARMTVEIFGSVEKKKIGDSWPVNTHAMKVDVTDPQSVDPRALAGDITLKGQRAVMGVDCLQVEAVLRTTSVSYLPIPPTDASVTVTYAASLPVNPAVPMVAMSMKTATHVVIEQKPLGKGVVRTTSDSEVSHEATWFSK
jgi:hypothetical protein